MTKLTTTLCASLFTALCLMSTSVFAVEMKKLVSCQHWENLATGEVLSDTLSDSVIYSAIDNDNKLAAALWPFDNSPVRPLTFQYRKQVKAGTLDNYVAETRTGKSKWIGNWAEVLKEPNGRVVHIKLFARKAENDKVQYVAHCY